MDLEVVGGVGVEDVCLGVYEEGSVGGGVGGVG